MQLLQGGTQLYSNALPRLQMPSTDSNVRKQKQDTGVTSGRPIAAIREWTKDGATYIKP